jgi:hypothetical protein
VLGVGALAAVVVLGLILGCGPAAAASHHPAAGTAPDPTVQLKAVVNRATRWVSGILATGATFFFTLGGARYMSSGGDPSEVERAKGSFKNAGIGYALAILAPVLLRILQSIVSPS